jgi:N-acetyl-gamma-glutamyl-phosphate reductase
VITTVGIVGVSGYTGQTLLRLLLSHPFFKVSRLFSTGYEGPIGAISPVFQGYSAPYVELFSLDRCDGLDLIFLAVPHTKAMALVPPLREAGIRVVDLSADFRLRDVGVYESYYGLQHEAPHLLPEAVYGLPEKYRDRIRSADMVAVPGCYATSMILGLLPMATTTNGPVVIDAKSGASGAGKTPKPGSLFCEVHDTLTAYATGTHRHTAEVVQETGVERVLVSPHVLPVDRGIEAALYMTGITMDQAALTDCYESYYKGQPFVQVMSPDTTPDLRLVQYSNRCVIIPKKVGEFAVVFSLIDNLVKGASGQAVQNANIMMGYDETSGLLGPII